MPPPSSPEQRKDKTELRIKISVALKEKTARLGYTVRQGGLEAAVVEGMPEGYRCFMGRS